MAHFLKATWYNIIKTNFGLLDNDCCSTVYPISQAFTKRWIIMEWTTLFSTIGPSTNMQARVQNTFVSPTNMHFFLTLILFKQTELAQKNYFYCIIQLVHYSDAIVMKIETVWRIILTEWYFQYIIYGNFYASIFS